MAEYEVGHRAIGAHGKTLQANTADTVSFADDLQAVEVVSDGSAELYFRVDGVALTVGDPKAYYLPAVASSRVVSANRVTGPTVVTLISPGAPTYSAARAAS